MADGNIGSVGVSVVPDATDFWRRFVATTSPGAENAGRNLGRGVRRGIQGELDSNPANIRVNADTARARAQLAALGSDSGKSLGNATKQSNLLRDAIVALGPAAIPVAGVLGGALIGLVPTLAAVALGVKGVSEEFKSGALDGTQYGADIRSLQNEFATLKTIASGGILVGLNNAMKGSGPLLKEVNSDTAALSAQFGQIAGDAAPALLSLLTQLNPLFTTFGQVLVDGAAHLKTWAQSGKGVSGFVAYVQNELPTVINAVQSLAVTAAHLVEGLAPLGHASLIGITLLSDVISAIPVDVLSKLASVATAAYGAFKVYGAITAIVSTVSASIAANAAAQAAAALQFTAASAAIEAAAAQEAAVVAETRFVEARASTAAALQIALALEGTGSALELEALAAVESAGVFAGAMRAEAAAAQAAAAQVAAASAEASAAARAGAVGASGGFAAALGPIGAVVAGLGILSFAFLNSGSSTQKATQDTNDYTQALTASHGAITQNIRDSAAKKLQDSGALEAAQKFGIQLPVLTDAVLGNASAQAKVKAATEGFYAAMAKSGQGTAVYRTKLGATSADAEKLNKVFGEQTGAFTKAAAAAKLQREAAEKSATAIHEVNDAASRGAAAFGVTRKAYLDAAGAARKNAQDTAQQTLQMQIAGDAAGLLKQALDKLSGKKVSYAQADNAFQQSLVSLQKNLRDNSKAIRGLSEDAIGNRGALIGLVTQAQTTAEAYGNLRNSSEVGRKKLTELRAEIINNAVAQGANRQAVTEYVDSLLKIPKKVPPTKLQVEKRQAEADIATFQGKMNAIRQGRVPGVLVGTLQANELLAELQRKIDALHGKTITVQTVNLTGTDIAGGKVNVKTSATGGFVHGPGTGTSDTAGLYALSNGEAVIPAKAVSANHALVASLIEQGRGMAAGGVVSINAPTSGAGSASAAASAQKTADKAATAARAAALQAIKDAAAAVGQAVAIPFDVATVGIARVSTTLAHASAVLSREVAKGLITPQQRQAAEAQLAALAAVANRQLAALRVKIKGSDLTDLKNSLSGSASDIRAAFSTIFTDINRSGGSTKLITSLKTIEGSLTRAIARRDKVKAALGDPPDTAKTAYDRLGDALSKFRDERTAVADAVKGSFDITSAGANPVTGKISGDGLLAQSKQNRNLVHKFVADAKKLKGLINDTYWAQLVGDGPDALPQIDALLSLSKADRKTIDDNQKAVAGAGASLGGAAADQLYGTDLANAKTEVRNLQNRLHADNVAIRDKLDRVANKLDTYSHRVVTLEANGRELARVVNTENNKGKART